MSETVPKMAGEFRPAVASQKEPVAPLVSAAASGDPAVHQILAERQTAVMNGDDDRAAEMDKALADLGFQ